MHYISEPYKPLWFKSLLLTATKAWLKGLRYIDTNSSSYWLNIKYFCLDQNFGAVKQTHVAHLWIESNSEQSIDKPERNMILVEQLNQSAKLVEMPLLHAFISI